MAVSGQRRYLRVTLVTKRNFSDDLSQQFGRKNSGKHALPALNYVQIDRLLHGSPRRLTSPEGLIPPLGFSSGASALMHYLH